MGHRLEAQVHQFPAVGEMVQHIGDMHMPLVREVGQRAGEKAVDDIPVLAFNAQRFDRPLQLATCAKGWRGFGRAQDAPPVSISVAKWSGSPSAVRIAAAMLAML